ncbi:MAG: DUF423 domain-containing protein [Saprospiraceae bacterium]|nr:DUF423 domain-containing protein [Saprospiraceae bacterium]
MNRFTKNVLMIGAIAIMTAIILGAFGAHALQDKLSEESLEVFKTGVQYQFMHGFAILICGLLSLQLAEARMRNPVILFVLGTIFFSGSLYLLSTREITNLDWPFLGPITPLGGLFFIVGWLLFVMQIVKK